MTFTLGLVAISVVGATMCATLAMIALTPRPAGSSSTKLGPASSGEVGRAEDAAGATEIAYMLQEFSGSTNPFGLTLIPALQAATSLRGERFSESVPPRFVTALSKLQDDPPPIENLQLTVRAYNALKRRQVHDAWQLVTAPTDVLRSERDGPGMSEQDEEVVREALLPYFVTYLWATEPRQAREPIWRVRVNEDPERRGYIVRFVVDGVPLTTGHVDSELQASEIEGLLSGLDPDLPV